MNSVRAVAEDLTEIRRLVETVAAQATSIRCRRPSAIADNYATLRKFPEISNLESHLVRRWPAVLADLDAVADTDMEKAVVLFGCGKLSEESYVEFLDTVLSLVKQGRLDREYFSFVENPIDETSEGWAVLVRRSEEPSVQSIIRRARALFHDRQDMVHEFDQMLSGESRRKLERFKATSSATSPVVVPGTTLEHEAPDMRHSAVTNDAEKRAAAPSAPPSTSNSPPVSPPERPTVVGNRLGNTFPLLVIVCVVAACGVIVWLRYRR